MWIGIGIAVLILAGVGALLYVNRASLPQFGGSRLTVTKDLTEGTAATQPPPGEATHVVKAGENLWAIAKHSGVVDSPWEWRTILVQNRDKIDYAFVSEEEDAWKVMVEEGKVLKVRRNPPPAAAGNAGTQKIETQYAVQLIALPESRLKQSTELVKMLLANGQYAYLYLQELDGKRFYRIRAGFFSSEQDAEIAGEELTRRYADHKIFKDYWVVIPSQRELRGEKIDFGAQQSKPWVVELPERQSQGDALDDLRKVARQSEFSYIAQKKDGAAQPAHYLYRIRIGFFGTEEAAQQFIQQKQAKELLLGQAHAVKLENFNELLPGQNLKLSERKS